jgi:aspartate aminotransferase
VYNKEELRELVDLALEYNLFLISDEVYREFAYEKKPISIANIPEVFEQAILVDSCSKRFNMCGARVGVLATKNKEVLDAVLKFGMARLSVATVEQLAMVPMLNNPDAFVKPMVEEFHLRRDAVYERLTKIADVTYYKPEGAFYIVVGLPVNDAEHFAKWLIEEYDDNNETVLVAPAQGFYATPGKGKNEVRLAFMLNVPDLQRSLEIIEKALNVYRGQFI